MPLARVGLTEICQGSHAGGRGRHVVGPKFGQRRDHGSVRTDAAGALQSPSPGFIIGLPADWQGM